LLKATRMFGQLRMRGGGAGDICHTLSYLGRAACSPSTCRATAALSFSSLAFCSSCPCLDSVAIPVVAYNFNGYLLLMHRVLIPPFLYALYLCSVILVIELQSWVRIQQSPQPIVDCQSLDGLPSGLALPCRLSSEGWQRRI
jgi:hypothetical protein